MWPYTHSLIIYTYTVSRVCTSNCLNENLNASLGGSQNDVLLTHAHTQQIIVHKSTSRGWMVHHVQCTLYIQIYDNDIPIYMYFQLYINGFRIIYHILRGHIDRTHISRYTYVYIQYTNIDTIDTWTNIILVSLRTKYLHMHAYLKIRRIGWN